LNTKDRIGNNTAHDESGFKRDEDFQISNCGPQKTRRRPDVGRLLIAQDRDRTIADSTEKSSDFAKGAAKSAAIDPELAELSAQWHTLPAIIKSAIMAVARQNLPTGLRDESKAVVTS